MPPGQHRTLSLPYSVRADLPNTPPLASYLLRLISIKRSNLCVSADVHSSSALLRLAEDVGDSICVLKTHADIIDDFSERTFKRLGEIARTKSFLIFEDRKFGDIGNTVQSQYARGPLSIAKWAHLTNAHLLPGPTIVPALLSAATTTLTALNQSVSTEISIGTPSQSVDGSASEDEDPSSVRDSDVQEGQPNESRCASSSHRKTSGVKTTITISQTYEPSPPNPATLSRSLSANESASVVDREHALQDLGPPPHARGLLLLAEMSSEGNLIRPDYTEACIAAAHEHPEFVLGFVSQHSLNRRPDDIFLHFTPGVCLPPATGSAPAGREAEITTREQSMGSDGLGQQWQTPRRLVVEQGADILIVGRGVLRARDREKEAERYRKAGWEAYEERIGRRDGADR